MDVFNELLETIKRGAVDNKITITNVELFVSSWQKERELQLRKTQVSSSFSECTCLRPQTNCFSGNCTYCNRTINKPIISKDLKSSFYCFERHIETGDCKKQCKDCKKHENN